MDRVQDALDAHDLNAILAFKDDIMKSIEFVRNQSGKECYRVSFLGTDSCEIGEVKCPVCESFDIMYK